MMMTGPRSIACTLVLTFASAGVLQAQDGAQQQERQVFGGVHAGYAFEDFSEFGAGIHAAYPLADFFLGTANFTYYFPGDDIDFWEFNVNGQYLVQVGENLTPYIGLGLNYSRVGFDTPDNPIVDSVSSSEFGFNVLAGVFRNLGGAARVFGEARYVVSDLDQFIVTAGISVPLFTVQ